MNASLSLRFKSIRDKIEDAGRRSAQFLSRQGLSAEAVRVQMEIVRELIASVRSFDADKRSGRSLALRMEVSESAVTTEVSLPVDEADRPRIAALERTIQQLRGSQSPLEAYLNQSSARGGRACHAEPHGAGLARIAHEAQALVDFFVDEDRSLTLSAVGPLLPEERSAGRRRRKPSAIAPRETG